MLQKLSDFVLSFDLFSPSPGFTHKGKSRFSSFIGLLITVGIYGLSVAAVKDLLKSFFLKIDPRVTTELEYSGKEEFLFSNSSINIFFELCYFNDVTYSFTPIERSELNPLAKLVGLNETQLLPSLTATKIYKESNVTFYDQKKNTPLNPFSSFIFCENASFIDRYNEGLNYGEENSSRIDDDQILKYKKNAFCIPDDFSQLIFNNGSLGYAIPIVYIRPLIDVIHLNSKFSNLFLKVYYPVLQISKDPYETGYFKKVWKWYYVYFDPGYNTFQKLVIRKTKITKNFKDFLFTSDQTNYTFTVEEVENSFKSSSLYPLEKTINPCLIIYITLDNYVSSITFDYTSLDDIIGLFGGTVGFFLGWVQLLFSFLVEPFALTSTINSVFELHENSLTCEDSFRFLHSLKTFGKSVPKEDDLHPISRHVDERLIQTIELDGSNIARIDNIDAFEHKLNSRVKLPILDEAEETKRKIEESSARFSKSSAIVEKLKSLINSRKATKVKYKDLCRNTVFSLCSPKETPSDDLLAQIIEYCNLKLEVSSYIRLARELELLRYLLLSKDLRNLFILPSLNINYGEIKSLPPESENDDTGAEEVSTKVSLDSLDKLKALLESDSKIDKKLAKNIIKSII